MSISPTVEDLKRWLDGQGGRTWLWARGVRMPIRPDLEVKLIRFGGHRYSWG